MSFTSTLDEMKWKSYMELSNEIIVIPSEKMNRKISSEFLIKILEVENYYIGKNYYKSKDVLNFYNQTIIYVNQYKSGLNFTISYKKEFNFIVLPRIQYCRRGN